MEVKMQKSDKTSIDNPNNTKVAISSMRVHPYHKHIYGGGANLRIKKSSKCLSLSIYLHEYKQNYAERIMIRNNKLEQLEISEQINNIFRSVIQELKRNGDEA